MVRILMGRVDKLCNDQASILTNSETALICRENPEKSDCT